jgi:hypothetical protein
MATDEEELAAIREAKEKAKFHGWMDEWFTKKTDELKKDDPPPKRTQPDSDKPSIFSGLFGGI